MKRTRRRAEGRRRPSAFFSPALWPRLLLHRLGQAALVPPSRAYALWRRLGGWLHCRGLCRTCRPGPPAVAVGGMSPDSRGRVLLTSWLLGWAGARGVRAAVTVPRAEAEPPRLPFRALPDGDPRESGIEAALLARYSPDGRILVDVDPIRAVEHAVRDFDPDLLLLQDAVTDWRVCRDLNLCILTPEDLGANWDRPVPAGNWRADASVLTRADAFCVFAGPKVLEPTMVAASRRLSRLGRPVFGFTFDIWRFRGPAGTATAEDLGADPYIAVLGESDRDILPDLLRDKLGAAPRMAFFYHDRHRFTRQDFEHLRADAVRLRAARVLTSPRQALKLRQGGEALSGLSVWTYDPEVIFGPSQSTEAPFLSWWEAALAAVAGTRPERG